MIDRVSYLKLLHYSLRALSPGLSSGSYANRLCLFILLVLMIMTAGTDAPSTSGAL